VFILYTIILFLSRLCGNILIYYSVLTYCGVCTFHKIPYCIAVTRLTILTKDDIIIVLSALSARKEVKYMKYIMSFVVSVMARLVGDRLSKWLDRHEKHDN
jgi:hypothetical protein